MQASLPPKPELANPTAGKSAPVSSRPFVFRDRRAHPQETDRQTQLLRFLGRLPWRKPAPSAIHIVRWDMAKAREPPIKEARQPRLAARPTHVSLRAWRPGRQ